LHTSGFHREAIRLVHNAFFQSGAVSATFAGIRTALHVHGERRTWDRHVVVENIDGVTTLLERRVADAISAITLGDDELLGLSTTGIAYGARYLTVVCLRFGDVSRVYRERRLLIHM